MSEALIIASFWISFVFSFWEIASEISDFATSAAATAIAVALASFEGCIVSANESFR
jgi:hypothetical protein